jgi:DNA/RNA-binding domain of Phe-tRNA-synthetase-like protein
MAELEDLLLTAGHDMDALQPPVRIDVAVGDERSVGLRGEEHLMKPSDMMMRDKLGVISSVVYGPDYRTRIIRSTQHVMFATYAPPGIMHKSVYEHLQHIRGNVLLIAPRAEVEMLDVYETE